MGYIKSPTSMGSSKKGVEIMSKGSTPRPVDKKKYDENYDRIFGKKKKEQPTDNKENKWKNFGQKSTDPKH